MTDMRRRLALGLFIAVLAVCALALRAVPVSTDLSFFTPENADGAEGFLISQMTGADGIAMMAVSGDDSERVRTATAAITAMLASMPSVARVMTGGMSPDAETRAFLLKNRYVLGPALAADEFTEANMHAKIGEGLKQLAGGIGPAYRDIFPRDPTGRALAFLNAGPSTRTAGGGRAPILAVLNIAADDIPGHAAIRDAITGTLDDPAYQGVRTAISGPGFFALDARERIRSEMHVLATLASAGVALVLFAAFRGPVILIAIALPVAFGLLGGIFVTGWVFGSVHGVAIAFASVMVGVAVDYPVHLASFRKPGEGGYDVARRIFPVMALGAGTTLAGFVILSQSSFPGLAQIGTLTSTAIVVAVLFTRFLLPLALPARPLDFRPGDRAFGFLKSRPGLRRHLRRVLYAVPLVGALGVALSGQPLWDDDIRSLRLPNDSRIQIDRELRKSLAMPDVSHLVLIAGQSRAEVLEKQSRVSAQLRAAVDAGRLGGYVSLTDVVPPAADQKARLAQIPDVGQLRERLAHATAALPVRPGVFEPFIEDVEAARAAGPVGIDDPMLKGLTSLMMRPVETADGWVNAIRLIAPIDAAALRLDDARVVNLRQMASEMVEDYRVEGLELLGIGALAGLLIVIVGRRGVRPALSVIRAPLIAVCVSVAVLVLTGTPLGFFHLLALVLVVSIGVDYELFFAGYGEGADGGTHSFNSVMLCFVSTFLVFAVLATSGIPMLHAIGMTVALGAASSFLITVTRAGDGGTS